MQEENVFRKLRHEYDTEMKDFTATQLAQMIGLSKRVISQVEHDGNASLSTLEAYHNFFKVPFEYLLGYKGSTRHCKNMSIGKATGLSDKAIENLISCKKIQSETEIPFCNTASEIIGHPQFIKLIQLIIELKNTRKNQPTLAEELDVQTDVMLEKYSRKPKNPLLKWFASYEDLIAARKLKCQNTFIDILESVTIKKDNK